MGLMDKLSSIAAGPAGQVLWGFLSGEIEEMRMEQMLQQQKDDRKAALVQYASEHASDNYGGLI